MRTREINIGDIYNQFTIISKPYHKSKYRVVDCQCKCGTIVTIYCGSIKKLTQCKKCTGKQFRKWKIGQQIASLTVLDYEIDSNKNTLVKIKCNCGKIYSTDSSVLNKIKSCKDCYDKKRAYGYLHYSFQGEKYVSKTYFNQIKNNAKKRNLEFKISIQDIENLLTKQHFKCKLSGLDISVGNCIIETTASLDRIDSNKGYHIDNIQWIHKDIQRMKSNFNENYFIKICQLISENHK